MYAGGMRTSLTREERKARTRAELIGAAERLFTSDGFHATSVETVADEAGYTKGAVYSNFASKEDLFFAVYERRAERGVAEMERGSPTASGRDRGAGAAEAARRRGRRRLARGVLRVLGARRAPAARCARASPRCTRARSDRSGRRDGAPPRARHGCGGSAQAGHGGLRHAARASLERLTQPDSSTRDWAADDGTRGERRKDTGWAIYRSG